MLPIAVKRSVGRLLLAATVLLLGQQAFGQSCPVTMQLNYPNGEKGCISDLPISKRYMKSWGKTLEEVIKFSPAYSLAVSAICPDIHIASRRTLQLQLDSEALGSCDSKCECATVIRNGRVLIAKDVAMALGADVSTLAAKPINEDKKLKQQEKENQVALQHLQEEKQQDQEKVRERERLKLEAERREQEQLALAQRLKAQQRLEDEARLLEQIKREKALKEREEALAAQEIRIREQQRAAEEIRLKEEERRLQAAKREEESRKAAAASANNADRELLMQLAAELAKLRQQQAEQDKRVAQAALPAQSVAAVSAPTEVLAPVPIMANRKALVIGNDRYKFVSPLNTAKEDAKSMAESLKSVGYQVSLKLDVSEKEFKATLRQFRNQVEAGDEVAFFYAGHGVQLNNNNFLVPVDVAGESEDQLRDEAIPLQRFLDDMNDKRVKFSLAMIDACRDNPFKTNGRALGGGTRGLAPTTAATGQMVVFSAGTGQQALDKLGPNDKDKNGVFTRIFVREMQKPGVTVDRIVRNVRSEVVNLAKSVGHDQVPAIYDQTIGEFYFRSK